METQLRVENAPEDGIRADKYIAEYAGIMSRNQLQVRNMSVSLKGKTIKLSRKVFNNEELVLNYDPAPESSVEPEDIPLQILYEDDRVLVVNKPRGMVVHPAAGNYTGTLVQGILHHCKQIKNLFPDEPVRPGIVHRLDRDTSGVIIAAKDPEAREYLSAQFRRKKSEKWYLAVVKGSPRTSTGTLESYLIRDPRHRKKFTWSDEKGKWSVTDYRILKRYPGYTFMLLMPRTGRTHQLRVHMQMEGCPILGDPHYSRQDQRFSQVPLMLHAYKLTIKLPETKTPATFRAPVPTDMRGVLMNLYRDK